MEETDPNGPGLGAAPTQGWHSPVPGLVVVFRCERIRLTHQDSGHYLAAFPTVDAALGAALAVEHLCDWTLPLPDIELGSDELSFLCEAVTLYQGGDPPPKEVLPPFDFHWSEPHALLPPTDSEVGLVAPGWPTGVDGLAVVYAARQVRLVHVPSGRALSSFPTVPAAQATAPFLLPLVAPGGWLQPYGVLAPDRSLWSGVKAAAAVSGGGPSVPLLEALPEPELRCLVLRPAWSTRHDELVVVLASDGLHLAERVTGELFADTFDQVGQARRAAAALAADLSSLGMSPSQWSAHWRALNDVDEPLGPSNPRGR
jgi:hypothetical protein